MTDVLVVAYHYPPIASGGTERALSFARHLPEHGYRSHVLTTDTFGSGGDGSIYRAGELVGWYRRWFNRSLDDLPEHARSRTRTDSALSPLARLARSVLIPDAQVAWLPAAYRTARHIIQSHPVRLVLTTAPPFSAHLLGLALHRTTQLPWVADYRDSWTYDPLDPALENSRLRARIERVLERRVVRAASHVTSATGVAAAYLRDLDPATGVTVVPNGFADAVDAGDAAPSGKRTRFVHTGAFSASHPKRSPMPLLNAARALADDGLDFELVLAGPMTPQERDAVLPLEATGHATVHGSVTRDEALRLQRQADVLLVVDHPRSVLASNVPGKVYEYGASGKPMLAVVPRGATRDLIASSGTGLCVGHDPVEIAGAMRVFVAGESGVSGNANWWRQFERSTGVARMAAVFDRVLGKRV